MLSLALTTLALLPQTRGVSSSLSAAPEGAFLMVYTPDVAAVRSATLESPWYRYFAEGPGNAYVETARELLVSVEEGGEADFSLVGPALSLIEGARGDALLYATDHGVGLVVGSGEGQQALDEQLDDFLDQVSERWIVTATGSQGRRVETWRVPELEDFVLGRGRGLGVSSIFLGEDESRVRAALTDALTRRDRGASTAGTGRIAGRLRGGAPRLVIDLDLERMASFLVAEEPEAEAFVRALGFAEENHVLADVHRGSQGLHELVRWRFPADSGLARLAQSFQPVEMRDLVTLPAGSREFSVLRWQPQLFLDAALELAGPQGKEVWGDAMLAGESAMGVRLDTEVIAQFSGRFAGYRAASLAGGVSIADPLQGMSMQIGVRDGFAMEDAFASLLEATGASGMFELDSYGDHDVWVPAGDLSEGGGLPRLVFTETTLVIVNGQETLEHALAPFSGGTRPSLADDSAQVAALRSNAGAFFVGYQEMAATMATLTQQIHTVGSMMQLDLGEAPSLATLREWFPGLAVSAWKRTPEGLEFRASVR